jgi:hypothetical protein
MHERTVVAGPLGRAYGFACGAALRDALDKILGFQTVTMSVFLPPLDNLRFDSQGRQRYGGVGPFANIQGGRPVKRVLRGWRPPAIAAEGRALVSSAPFCDNVLGVPDLKRLGAIRGREPCGLWSKITRLEHVDLSPRRIA